MRGTSGKSVGDLKAVTPEGLDVAPMVVPYGSIDGAPPLVLPTCMISLFLLPPQPTYSWAELCTRGRVAGYYGEGSMTLPTPPMREFQPSTNPAVIF